MGDYGADALYGEMKRAIAILRAAAIETRLTLAMNRLRLALKAGYDPNQPREPAGRPTGGRWAGDGQAATSMISIKSWLLANASA